MPASESPLPLGVGTPGFASTSHLDPGLPVKRDDVMHDAAIARSHFDSLDPGVLVEPGRHHDPLIVDRSLRPER